MHEYIDALVHYRQFSGSASRKAFWTFFALSMLVSLVFTVAEILWGITWKIEALYSLLIFLPFLSLTVRRLHDADFSAWCLLAVLVPVIGMVLLLILLALPSKDSTQISDRSQNDLTV